MKKRIGFGLFLMTVIFVLLTGCGGAGKEKKVTIKFWDGTWNEETFAKIVTIWNERYPNITVEPEFYIDQGMLDKYILSMRNGTAGDVVCVQIDWANTFASAGLLEPLDDYIKEDNLDISGFVPGALRAATVNGKLHALPYRCETFGLYYNKDMFNAAGLTRPPETWDEVLEYSKILTGNGNAGFGLTGTVYSNFTFNFVSMLRSSGGDILTDDNSKSRLDDSAGIQTAALYNELKKYAPASFLENAGAENRNLFIANKVAMYLNSISELIEIDRLNPNCNFGVALMPTGNGAERKTILGGWNVVIPATSKHKKEAWKFLQFLTSSEIAAMYSRTFTGNRVPAENNSRFDPEKVAVFQQALQWAAAWPAVPSITAIRQEIYDNMQMVLTDMVSPRDGMIKASENVNKLLAGN